MTARNGPWINWHGLFQHFESLKRGQVFVVEDLLRILIASLRLVVLKKRRLSRLLLAFLSFVSNSLLYTLLEDEGKFHS